MVKSSSKPLEIRLTEPVIFLKGPSTGLDFRGRRTVIQDGQPAMLRGLLTLRLSKPTRIRVITVRLEAKARTEWPEGIGPRRIDTFEEHQLLSELTTFFNARKEPVRSTSARRASSVGPGVTAGYQMDDDSDISDDETPMDEGDDDPIETRGRGRERFGTGGVQTSPRSASALPAGHDGTRYHRDGFSRRPSYDREASNTSSPRPTYADLAEDEATLTRRRGASPAYSAIDRHPRADGPGPSALSGVAGSTLYYRGSSTSPMPFSRESALSPIVSANASRAASDRAHSGSTERGRPSRRSADVGAAVPEGVEPTAGEGEGESGELRRGEGVIEDDRGDGEEDEEMDALVAGVHRRLGGLNGPPSRSILNVQTQGARSASMGEVRFADPTPPDSRPDPIDGLDPGSPNLGPQGDHTAELAHPHMAAVHSISALSTAHNSPAPSRPTSIYGGRDDTLPPSGLRNLALEDESEPSTASSRRSSMRRPTLTDSAQASSPSLHLETRGRGGSTSTLDRGASAALPAGANAGARASPNPGRHPRDSPGGSPLASPKPRAASVAEERGRKPSKFSLGAALRDLSQRVSSKSRSRRPSASDSQLAPTSESSRPTMPHHPSSTSTAMSRESVSGTRDGPRSRRTSMTGAMQDPDFVPPHGRGGAGRINMSRERREMEAIQAERERSRVRTASPVGLGEEREGTGREGREDRSRSRGRNKALKALGKFVDGTSGSPRVEKEKHHEEDEDMHNWKEFRKGTYNYPISFQIPANSPPSLHAEFGSVTYRLKATVVRVGALTPNLTEELEVTTIATPQEDDLEETENVLVERQWEDQMRYQIALSGKAFPIGGTIPLSIRLMPLTKCRIHRVSVALEEKADYFALGKKATRHETPRKFVLLFVKQPERKERIEPLLPILSDDPDAARQSPLAEMARAAAENNPIEFSGFSEEDSQDAMFAQLMDPMGPWHLEKDLHVPDCASKIKFTTKHERTNIAVGHWLKITLRVERGDDEALDKAGRRKLFDIIIETPIKLLDCRVNPTYNSLPTYSARNPTAHTHLTSFCTVHGTGAARGGSSNGAGSGLTQGIAPVVPGISSLGFAGGYGPPPAIKDHHHGRSKANGEGVTSGEGDDSLLERNLVFDRLISGQETESGEAPPAYGEVLAGAARDAASTSRHGRGRAAAGVRVTSASASRSRSRIGSRGGD